MTPQEKRKKTIIERYGSFKAAVAKRDVRDLILGGYNGGKARTEKGFSTWEEAELKRFTRKKRRDSKGRFVADSPEAKDEDSRENTKE